MLSIDHVAIAVPDIDSAARDFERRSGLIATKTQYQQAWGTVTRIVPLLQGFLEFIAVADPQAAAGSLIGRRVAQVASGQSAIVAWAVSVQQLEQVAADRGLLVQSGVRASQDESPANTWQMAGIVTAFLSDLPLLIKWGGPMGNPHAGLNSGPAGNGAEGFAWIELDGETPRVEAWLANLPRDFELRVATRVLGQRRAAIRCIGRNEILVP